VKVAVIAPTPLLKRYVPLGDRYHLALNNLVLSSEIYSHYYRRRRDQGDFVILDNNAHELGVGDNVQRLIEGINLINPQEVVLPDRLFFGGDTIEMSKVAFYEIKAAFPNIRTMGVPQGRTYEEYLGCLGVLVMLGIDTIGVSKDYEVWTGGLQEVVRRVYQESYQDIHLLGWGRHLAGLRKVSENQAGRVRGVDSSKPLAYALNNIRLPGTMVIKEHDVRIHYPRRGSSFFEATKVNDSLARWNIEVFKGLAQSPSYKRGDLK